MGDACKIAANLLYDVVFYSSRKLSFDGKGNYQKSMDKMRQVGMILWNMD